MTAAAVAHPAEPLVQIVQCGRRYAMRQAHCDACGRPIRCVYREPEEGFLLGRRCYTRMQTFLAAYGTPVG